MVRAKAADFADYKDRKFHKVAEVEGQSNRLNEAAQNVAFGLQRGALEPLWLACVAICIDLPVLMLAFWFALYGASPAEQLTPVIAAGWAAWGLSAS
ncbi:hypothetical protein [Pseudophaeobacter leonis]|uniref:hypothetical protein n=1 Tax=Pseudophaeobacter leonis TaxID=1144477 RepID=UPI001F4E2500|nr:hypothetical protein [Pseudophaeobacter leonis]